MAIKTGENGVILNPVAKMKHLMDRDFNTDMLSGEKRHWCPDNGNCAIDNSMAEFDNCTCNLNGFN